MYFEERLKEKQLFNLDFNKLKKSISIEEVVKNNISNQNNKTINISKMFKLAIYTLFIMIISIGSTLLFTLDHPIEKQSIYTDKLATLKDCLLNKDIIDICLATGDSNEVMFDPFTTDIIYNSNIVSENNKAKVLDYQNKYNYKKIEIYFGIKDNKDIIVIIPADRRITDIPLVLESNLNYSFQSVIDNFESQSSSKLGVDEYLNNTDYDLANEKTSYVIVKGISLYFIKQENGTYKEYYQALINDKIYIVMN